MHRTYCACAGELVADKVVAEPRAMIMIRAVLRIGRLLTVSERSFIPIVPRRERNRRNFHDHFGDITLSMRAVARA